MTNEDTGKSFVALDMDETRELRWNFRNMQKFETRAKDLIKRLDLKNDRGQPIYNMAINTGFVLANFIKIADILEAAVAAATGISGLEGKKGEPSEASVAIQGYLDRAGDLETLQREIYRSYLVVNDPSYIGEWQENIVREAETKKINREKGEARIEIARMELADDLKKIETLKKISGNQSTA
jgi:hypothetical protein